MKTIKTKHVIKQGAIFTTHFLGDAVIVIALITDGFCNLYYHYEDHERHSYFDSFSREEVMKNIGHEIKAWLNTPEIQPYLK